MLEIQNHAVFCWTTYFLCTYLSPKRPGSTNHDIINVLFTSVKSFPDHNGILPSKVEPLLSLYIWFQCEQWRLCDFTKPWLDLTKGPGCWAHNWVREWTIVKYVYVLQTVGSSQLGKYPQGRALKGEADWSATNSQARMITALSRRAT